MQAIERFLAQLSTWSRALQWAFWAAAFTLAFLIWDATVAELGATWAAEVKQKELPKKVKPEAKAKKTRKAKRNKENAKK